MILEDGKVAIFHYSVSDADAETGSGPIESSREGKSPQAVLLGRGQLIPGVEGAMAGRTKGDRFIVRVEPEQGYGPRDPAATGRLPKKYFPPKVRLQPGKTVVLSTREGPRQVTVLKIGSSVVDVDLNHPLAGRTLVFDIEILDARDATADEIEHGHAHGVDGHAAH